MVDTSYRQLERWIKGRGWATHATVSDLYVTGFTVSSPHSDFLASAVLVPIYSVVF